MGQVFARASRLRSATLHRLGGIPAFMLPGRVDLWYDSDVTHFQAWRLFAPTAGESYTQLEDPADCAPTARECRGGFSPVARRVR
jgi:prolyl-tRNA editing enzyme YbaK/EbsC (Cys-tRNA(Pro) deacylase)